MKWASVTKIQSYQDREIFNKIVALLASKLYAVNFIGHFIGIKYVHLTQPSLIARIKIWHSILFISTSLFMRRIVLEPYVIYFEPEWSINLISCSDSKTCNSVKRNWFLSILNSTFAAEKEF